MRRSVTFAIAVPLLFALAALAATADAAPRKRARTASTAEAAARRGHAGEPTGPTPSSVVRAIESLDAPDAREERCRALTGYKDAPFERCSAEPIANGAAAIVRIETECGHDGCTTRGWLFGRGRPAVRIPGDASGTIDATPSLDVVVKDHVHKDARGAWDVSLIRVDMRTGAATPFAPCMSPVTSPGGKWFVCRDRAGAVYKLPVTGGRLELIAEAHPGDHIDWAPQSRVYPEQVDFRGDRALTYERQPKLGAPTEVVTLAWKE